MNNNVFETLREDKMAFWESDDVLKWLERISLDGQGNYLIRKQIIEQLSFVIEARKLTEENEKVFVHNIKECLEFEFESNKKLKMNRKEKRILRDAMQRQESQGPSKAYHDNVYGQIHLHPVLVVIMNTAVFERLRHIQQLGTSKYVYACGNGNRYCHSIGTSHLSKLFLDALFPTESDMRVYDITKADKLCVMIAALIHDLGHGPWSHLWDGYFINNKLPLTNPHKKSEIKTAWDHEMASKMLLRHLLKTDGERIWKVWNDYGIEEKDIDFITELIDPVALKGLKDNDPWPMKGRPESHACLYEIVSNKRTGLDVDKLDYLRRDLKNCKGGEINVDYNRLFANAKVMECPENPDRSLIAFERKIDIDIIEVYRTRELNHRQIYQHKDNQAIEFMLLKALDLVKDSFLVIGSDGKKYKLHEAIFDMEAYGKLNEEYIFQNLLNSDMFIETLSKSEQDKWRQARELILQIQRGEIYTCLGQSIFKSDSEREDFFHDHKQSQGLINDVAEQTNEAVQKAISKGEMMDDDENVELRSEDLILKKGPTFDWGMKDKSPVEFVPFFEKHSSVAEYHKISSMMSTYPISTQEFGIRLYCEKLLVKNEACTAFEKVAKIRNLPKVRYHQGTNLQSQSL